MKKYKIKITLQGVGYKFTENNPYLLINLGHSHQIQVVVPSKVSCDVINNQSLEVSSENKQQLGEFAALLRIIKKPEPYKSKGIFLHFKKNMLNLQKREKKGKK